MNHEIKHSIFIDFPLLQPTVNELAAEVGNPSFMPHMTLAGNAIGETAVIIAAAEQIAARTEPFTVNFKGFGTEHREFRFFCLLAAPSATLTRLYDRVHQALPQTAEETFVSWPHASLFYGTAMALAKYPEIDPLVARYGTKLDGEQSVGSISVWETNGPVPSWRQVRVIPLQNLRK